MAQASSLFFEQASGGDAPGRVSVAHYSADEVIRQFLAIYNCLDFKADLEELGISRFQFARRKKALRELKALCIALWGLALRKSFPADAGDFFAEFRSVSPELAPGARDSSLLQNRINIYVDLLSPKKDADFLPVASYLAELLAPDIEDQRRLTLRLSLMMRNRYMMIFDKLV